jgi:hypothetical protein
MPQHTLKNLDLDQAVIDHHHTEVVEQHTTHNTQDTRHNNHSLPTPTQLHLGFHEDLRPSEGPLSGSSNIEYVQTLTTSPDRENH